MGLRAAAIAKAYSAVDFIMNTTVPIMPRRMHPGWQLCRALQAVRDAPSGPYFARAVVASRLRSALLTRYVLQLTRPQLRTFLEERVTYEGGGYAHYIFNGPRPVILAAPDYGVGTIGFLAAVHRMSGRRQINLFYDTAVQLPQIPLLFDRAGIDTTTLLTGIPGLLYGIRALARGEFLVMMPDAFDELSPSLAVPFFGRMLRVGPGTAFFSLRTNAWIVPVFASPKRKPGVHVSIGRPIDPQRFAMMDEAQAIFLLTRALFLALEREIRSAPEHWHRWAQFPRMSTSLPPPGRLDEDAPLRLLKDLCDYSPHLVLDVPELEQLVR